MWGFCLHKTPNAVSIKTELFKSTQPEILVSLRHRVKEEKVSEIPLGYLNEVCKKGQSGACTCLGYSFTQQHPVCLRNNPSALAKRDISVTATGKQYETCSGAPEHRQMTKNELVELNELKPTRRLVGITIVL